MSIEPAPDSPPMAPSRPRRRRRQHPPWSPQATKIKNGSAIIAGVNQSIVYVRRLKELLADYLDDMPQATTAERSLIRRACILEIELEHFETKFASAGEAAQRDLDLYARTTGNLRRVLQTLGLQRREPKGRTFGEMLAADYERQQREESEQKARAAPARTTTSNGEKYEEDA
jgi:hypothetical protein